MLYVRIRIPYQGNSNEYTQHRIIRKQIEKKTKKQKNNNYLCLEQFSMVSETFEPFEFDCIYGRQW